MLFQFICFLLYVILPLFLLQVVLWLDGPPSERAENWLFFAIGVVGFSAAVIFGSGMASFSEDSLNWFM